MKGKRKGKLPRIIVPQLREMCVLYEASQRGRMSAASQFNAPISVSVCFTTKERRGHTHTHTHDGTYRSINTHTHHELRKTANYVNDH